MKPAKYLAAGLILTNLLCSCKEKKTTVTATTTEMAAIRPVAVSGKPGSSFTDTLVIKGAAAIFYYPDSLQDAKIKAMTKPDIYNSSVHEMFYQMRNARMVIQKTYPRLKIVELHNKQYILIHKKDGGRQLLDLNKYNDARGLIMCNGIKEPQLADMTNIETELDRYFKQMN